MYVSIPQESSTSVSLCYRRNKRRTVLYRLQRTNNQYSNSCYVSKRKYSVVGIGSIGVVVATIVLASGCATTKPKQTMLTTSARGVILPGHHFGDVELRKPSCEKPHDQFLVHGIHAGPEIQIGATAIDVVKLPVWGVSVPVYQRHRSASVLVALTVVGEGPEHLSASIPAGQVALFGGDTLPVRVKVLGSGAATHRFEFNIHITGSCGTSFTASS